MYCIPNHAPLIPRYIINGITLERVARRQSPMTSPCALYCRFRALAILQHRAGAGRHE